MLFIRDRWTEHRVRAVDVPKNFKEVDYPAKVDEYLYDFPRWEIAEAASATSDNDGYVIDDPCKLDRHESYHRDW